MLKWLLVAALALGGCSGGGKSSGGGGSGGGGSNLQIDTSSLPTGRVGKNYSCQLSASGGSGSYTWSATGLPNGLSISSGGLISGVPKSATAASSPFLVTITVRDSTSPQNSASKDFSLTILPPTNFSKLAVFSGVKYEMVDDFCLDPNGNVLLAGDFQESEINFGADFGTTLTKSSVNKDYDTFIVKIKSDWTLAWVHRIGGSYTDTPEAICSDTTGAAIVVGSYLGTVDFEEDWGGGTSKDCKGFCDGYVVKIAENGNFTWAHRFGGDGADECFAVCTDSDNNVYVAGYFSSGSPSSPDTNFAEDFGGDDKKTPVGGRDVFLTKINANNTYGWTKTFGGSSNETPKVLRFCNGYLYMAGTFYGTTDFGGTNKTSAGQGDIFIVKLDTDGNVEWVHRIGGAGFDSVNDLFVDPNGYVYVAGSFQGTVNFKEDWNGTDSRSAASASDYNAFVTKITADGSYCWTRVFGGNSLDEATGVWADETSGNLFVTGYFYNTVNFAADFGGDDPRISAGDEELFLVGMTTSGDYKWTQRIGGTEPDKPQAGVVVDKANNRIYLAGFFNGTVNFKEDWAETESRTAQQNGLMDAFVLRLQLP